MSVINEADIPQHVMREKLRLERVLGHSAVEALGPDRHFILLFQVAEGEDHTGCVASMDTEDMVRFMKLIADDMLEFDPKDSRALLISVGNKNEH